MRFVGVLLLSGLALAALILGPVPAARAHPVLVKSSPANGGSVAQAPSVIRAWFSEELKVKGSTLRLLDARQKQVATGGVDLSVSKHDVMKIAPLHLRSGTYVVQWTAISADDNELRKSSFKFTVGVGAIAPKAPMAGLPPLHLISPTGAATVKNPVALVMETPGDISQLTMGGNMGSMGGMGSMSNMGPQVHLHVLADSVVIMPTAKQLTKVGVNRYQLQLPTMSPGTHTIKVYWADNKTHEPVSAVQMATCTITQ